MSRRLQLSPSILTVDFGRLAEEIGAVAGIVDWFHLDVMDGHYVPNLTFGPSIVEAVRKACDNPLHVHLMISEPLRYAPEFAAAGAERISFHPETVSGAADAIQELRDLGVGAGIAVHPDLDIEATRPYVPGAAVILVMTVRPGFGGQSFLPEVVPKIAAAKKMVEEMGCSADIEVDGGINLSTIGSAVGAGADILVAGSAIYDGVDPAAAARRLREGLDVLAEGIAGGGNGE